MKDLMYRISRVPMDSGLISITTEGDVNMMIAYARRNNFMIDLYVKHHEEEDRTGQSSRIFMKMSVLMSMRSMIVMT